MTVHFIGAGPGAADLITLRGRDLLAACPVCLYAGSIVAPELLQHCAPGTRLVDTAPLSLDEIVAEYVAAHAAGQDVARLHSGDLSIWSAVAEQIRRLQRHGIPYTLTPGVPAFAAAASALRRELTIPEVAQSLVLTRVSGRASKMPPGETLAAFGATGATLAIHLAIHTVGEIVATLSPLYGRGCPVAVVFRASWPDERVVLGTLADIAEKLAADPIERTAIIFVGRSLAIGDFRESSLYDAHYQRRFRGGTRNEATARGDSYEHQRSSCWPIDQDRAGLHWIGPTGSRRRRPTRQSADASLRSRGDPSACDEPWSLAKASPVSLDQAISRLNYRQPRLEPGHVWLAGAGPGDPGCLTLDVLSALIQADALVHDALVSDEIIAVAEHAEKFYVGKRGGRLSIPQDEINAILVRLAKEGRKVVRLKGGHPFVFARGAEEALALVAENIPFRVLSGVTSAFGGLASAGIPATIRGVNGAIILATGFAATTDDRPDWAALARTGQPIVIYMGLTHMAATVAGLRAGGLSNDIPAALVENATLPHERTVVATLGTLVETATRENVISPALIVIGHIVSMRAALTGRP